MRRRFALLAAVALFATGCASGTAGVSSAPTTKVLVRRAALEPCPTVHAGGGGLPAASLPCLDGGPAVRLSALRGPALVNVWASWCLPCQKELPELQRLHQLAGSRLLVLGVVSEDDQRDALDLLAHVGAHYPSVIDATGAKVHRLGLPGLPGSFLISTGGRIAKTYIGGLPALPQLEADIVHVLGVRV